MVIDLDNELEAQFALLVGMMAAMSDDIVDKMISMRDDKVPAEQIERAKYNNRGSLASALNVIVLKKCGLIGDKE
jgi:hypothetical protein